MSRLAADSLRRLDAMGVQVWQRRVDPPRRPPELGARSGDVREPPRIRLEAGHGAWLLVVEPAMREPHARLLADIQAVPGLAECRFGRWSDGGDSGIALSDVESYGIAHVLAFGCAASPGLIAVPGLDELAVSADARRALWQALKPRLDG